MKWTIKIAVFLILSLLVSCSNKSFPPIPEDTPLAITVNIKDMTVSFVDMETGEKIEEWVMEKPYIGGLILPDDDSLLLYGKHIETVDIFSLKEGKEISNWKTGNGIVEGKLLKNGREIVFADQTQDAVRFFTLDGKEIGKVNTKEDPLTLLEGEKNKSLYVVSFNANTLTEINIKKKKEMSSFPIHSSAAGALLRENENEIWIGGHGEGVEVGTDIYIYDVQNGQTVKQVSAPIMPINFTQTAGKIYALSHGSSTLYKINGEGTIEDSVKIGANPFEIKVFKDSLIVSGYDSNDIHIVDPDSLKIEKSIQVGKGPFQIILRERLEQ